MAHPINEKLNKHWKKEAIPCSNGCKYFKFPQNKRACVLSDVFSVLPGEPCFEFSPICEHDNVRITGGGLRQCNECGEILDRGER